MLFLKLECNSWSTSKYKYEYVYVKYILEETKATHYFITEQEFISEL